MSIPLGTWSSDAPNIAKTMYRMYVDSSSKRYYFDNAWDPSLCWVDLTTVDLSEGVQPSRLLVSGPTNLAGDVSANVTPAEPYAFLA